MTFLKQEKPQANEWNLCGGVLGGVVSIRIVVFLVSLLIIARLFFSLLAVT